MHLKNFLSLTTKDMTFLLCIALLLATGCAGKGFQNQTKKDQFYLKQGMELIDKKKYDLAISALTLSLNNNPDNIPALFWRARAAALSKRYDLALQDTESLLKIRPDHLPALILRSRIYLAQKKFALAEEDLYQALKRLDTGRSDSETGLIHRPGINLTSADLYYDLGTVNMAAGKFKQAVHCFSRTIGLKKTFAPAYNNRGSAFFKQGLFSRALADFSQAITLNPRQANYFFNRGLCHMKMHNRQMAIADFSRALDLQPDFALAFYNRGLLFMELGQDKLGCQDLQQACTRGICRELQRQQATGRCPCTEDQLQNYQQ